MQNEIDQFDDFNMKDRPECDKEFSPYVIEYQKQVEEIIVWLYGREDTLQQRPDYASLETAPFQEILEEYKLNEEFITELSNFSPNIMKCQEDGDELKELSDLTEEDRDEVGLQLDAMRVCYEKLKILATDRLDNLKRIVENRQESKVEHFQKWLTSTVNRLSNSNNIEPDYSAIQRQLLEMDAVRNELQQKQGFLDSMSNIIIFDDVNMDSLDIQTSSGETMSARLDNINMRWEILCKSVNDRIFKLQTALSIWELINNERPKLISWLDKVEKRIREMNATITSSQTFIGDNVLDPEFMQKLVEQSDKINLEIKEKQFYFTSLETRVRNEIDKIDDNCSIFVIELEKTLEETQDRWNTIINYKRKLDYKLQEVTNFGNIDRAHSSNHESKNEIRGHIIGLHENLISGNIEHYDVDNNDEDDDIKNEEINLDLHINHNDHDRVIMTSGSGSDNSKTIPTTQMSSDEDDDIQSLSVVSSFPIQTTSTTTATNDSNYSFDKHLDNSNGLDSPHNIALPDELSSAHNHNQDPQHKHNGHCNHGNCRVEEWKMSLETFVAWLKQVETLLCIERDDDDHRPPSSIHSQFNQVIVNNGSGGNPTYSNQNWHTSDLYHKLLIFLDVERQIKTSCQGEFECLMLQGKEIISDLLPELDATEYERELEDILVDTELRYVAVERTLSVYKLEFTTEARWLDLLSNLKKSSNQLIEQMGLVMPETSIGVDMLTLAQQQEELIKTKSSLESSELIHNCLQDAKIFLKLCDTLQQHLQQSQQQQHHIQSPANHNTIDLRSTPNVVDFDTEQLMGSPNSKLAVEPMIMSSIGLAPNVCEIHASLLRHRESIEYQLDRLTLHYSESLQLLDDRLDRLEEVHQVMHELQHSMQELASKLPIASQFDTISSWSQPLDDLSVDQLSQQLEDLKLYRERLGDVAQFLNTMNSIYDWMSSSKVPLSQQNMKKIHELNETWDLIEDTLDERQKNIEKAFDNQGTTEQQFLVSTLADLGPQWQRRVVATSKVPYFVDTSNDKTTWDHPKFSALLETMNSIKPVVFSAYRTALKVRIVQKAFGLDQLMLEQLRDVIETFEFDAVKEGGTKSSQQTPDDIQVEETPAAATGSYQHHQEVLVSVVQVIYFLKALYERIQADEQPDMDVPLCVELTLNWLLNLYDSTRTGYMSALSLKVGLALLCCATREEKYTYMFELVAQHSRNQLGVDGRTLGNLFEICIRIPAYLGEAESFGIGQDVIESNIRSCFVQSKFNPERPHSIDLDDYLNWLRTEPQFIVWLPVLHRLLVSENTVHLAKCKLCKTSPIVGLRYRCLKRFKYNICQNCFLTGRHIAAKGSPDTSQMQEYCFETSSGEQVRDLSKILRNKLKLKSNKL